MHHSADRKVCRTTKALEFVVLVVKKMAFELGWEELLPHEDAISDVVDADMLLAASQLFEPPEEPTENDDFVDADTESLLVAASQLYEPPKEPTARDRRFGTPRSAREIAEVEESRVPRKTKANTAWAIGIWREWATFCLVLHCAKCSTPNHRSLRLRDLWGGLLPQNEPH